MPKSIFISYVYEDHPWRDRVIGWARDGLLGNAVTTCERADVRQQGNQAIADHLKPMINGAAVVVCLVGQNTHNHDWVRYELDVATSYRKAIVMLRIPTTMGPAPVGHRDHEIRPFDPSTLRKFL